MAGTHDCVSFPVTKPAFAGNDLGTFIDAGAVGDLTPADVSAITLALLLLAAQMLMQGAAPTFLRINVEVDAFMTDGGLFLKLQPPSDLLWTPFKAQESLHLLPVVGEFICLIRAIALKAAVAPQFAGDRALVATDQYGDLRLVMSGSLQSVY